ncbi:hypothetical protein Hanom_Chr05g00443281 [Helianthus anomalus]
MKSQPFKLSKITTLMAVVGGYRRFLQLVVTSTFCCPLSPLYDSTACNITFNRFGFSLLF